VDGGLQQRFVKMIFTVYFVLKKVYLEDLKSIGGLILFKWKRYCRGCCCCADEEKQIIINTEVIPTKLSCDSTQITR